MLVLYLVLVVLAGGGMLMCAINTQVVNGDMWREKARAREEIFRTEEARRGTIFSSDGKVLATTVPVCDLCLDLGRWPKRDSRGEEVKDKAGNVVMESCIADEKVWREGVGKVCRILHEAQAMLARKLLILGGHAAVAAVIHGHHGLGLRGDTPLSISQVECQGIGVDVAADGHATGTRDGLHRGHKRE